MAKRNNKSGAGTALAERTEAEPEEAGLAVVSATDPLSIIRAVASDPGCDVGKLERLMVLQERFEANAARKAWAGALATFQTKCPVVVKTKTAGDSKFNYRYAGYEDIMRAIAPVLAECGMSISFSSEQLEGDRLRVTCFLAHETHTESRTFTCPVPEQMRVNQTQKMGAALSYAKRYALCGALNIVVANEDWDGAPPNPQSPADPSAPKAAPRADRGKAPDQTRINGIYKRWLSGVHEGDSGADEWFGWQKTVAGRAATATYPLTDAEMERLEIVLDEWDEAKGAKR